MPSKASARASTSASGAAATRAIAKAAEKRTVTARPVLKKPAASARRQSAAAQSQLAKPVTRKRPATAAKLLGQEGQTKKCKSIVSALAGVDELSPKLREMLACLTDLILGPNKGMPSAYQEPAVMMVWEGLCSAERKLEQELARSQTTLQDVCMEKEARDADVNSVDTRQVELKRIIAESKMEIKESTKAIETSTYGLKDVKDLQKASQDKLEVASAKVEQLRNLDQDLYQPLKVAPVPGCRGTKQVNRICKVGKDFGFQDSVLEDIAGVLKKGLDKRCTFDGLVMDRLESEFSEHYGKLEGALQDEQVTFQECTGAVQGAHTILNDSVQARKHFTKTLTEAEAVLTRSRAELPKARQSARKLQVDLEKAVRDMTLAEARLEAFRSGPLAAFSELQQGLILPEPSIGEAVEAIAAEPASHSTACTQLAVAVAWNPSSPVSGDASLARAPAAQDPAHADTMFADAPTVKASASAVARLGWAQAPTDTTLRLARTANTSDLSDVTLKQVPTIEALADAHAAFPQAPVATWARNGKTADLADATLEQMPSVDALSHADATLPPTPIPNTSELADDTLACAPTIDTSDPMGATLAWAPTEILMDED